MSETWHGDEVPSDVESAVRGRRTGLWVGIAVAVVAIGAGVWFWFFRTPAAPPAPPPVAEAPPPPAPAAPPKVSIEEGENLLRQIGARLSSAAELKSWLAEKDILRRLVAAANLVAEGKTPSNVLGFLKPARGYEVVKRKKHVFASPKSGARYDLIAKVMTGIDPEAVGKAYGEAKPYLDSAYAEVGPPGKSFDGVVRAAIDTLTATPIPAQEQELKAKGLGYAYADPKLEGLNGAQKQLLRMGLRNAQTVQDWLKKVETALPPESAAR
jgi:hypothetical protein